MVTYCSSRKAFFEDERCGSEILEGDHLQEFMVSLDHKGVAVKVRIKVLRAYSYQLSFDISALGLSIFQALQGKGHVFLIPEYAGAQVMFAGICLGGGREVSLIILHGLTVSLGDECL